VEAVPEEVVAAVRAHRSRPGALPFPGLPRAAAAPRVQHRQVLTKNTSDSSVSPDMLLQLIVLDF
jgi:hypothetical protein